MHLSIAVVLFHAALAFVYGVYRIVDYVQAWLYPGRTTISSAIAAWNDSNEMLALALLSDHNQARKALGNAGAGIGRADTLNQMVRIRMGQEDNLQMVVGEENWCDDNGKPRYRRVVADKKYS